MGIQELGIFASDREIVFKWYEWLGEQRIGNDDKITVMGKDKVQSSEVYNVNNHLTAWGIWDFGNFISDISVVGI